MKPEEVLDVLKRMRIAMATAKVDGIRVLEPLNVAIQALEKQVPKKVKNIRFSREHELAEHNIMEGECPECGETMTGNTFGYYCGCCGVALDWGYEE